MKAEPSPIAKPFFAYRIFKKIKQNLFKQKGVINRSPKAQTMLSYNVQKTANRKPVQLIIDKMKNRV